MSTPLLVRHPAPHPTESLIGYVLRLSEENGYDSPWSVYSLAGLKQNEIRTVGFKLHKLAAIVNQTSSELDKIGFSTEGQPRSARLLGNRLIPTDLKIVNPGLCPRCVAEIGFVEAHWHLTFMTGCPMHLCMRALSCPTCGKQPRLFRRGLLECSCGGNLLECNLPPIPKADAALLDIIRRKALGLGANDQNPLSLPQMQLMAMNLRAMLIVARTLGKYRLIADGSTSFEDEPQVVSAAARVIVDWPKNFIGLLQDLGKQLQQSPKGGVRKQFEPIYCALFKNRAINPSAQTGFLREAFLEFAENYWGRGYVDPKLLKLARRPGTSRFVTKSEFAVRVGIHSLTASRLIEEQKITARRVRCGKSQRILVDMSQSVFRRASPGKIHRARDAAKQLGISIGLLKTLKESGTFEFNHHFPTKGGYHELDIEAFKTRLLSRAPAQKPVEDKGNGTLEFKALMCGHHDAPATKGDLVQALLCGDLAIVGNTNGSVAGLIIDGAEYHRLARAARSRAAGDTMPAYFVENQLNCDASTVPGLMKMGLLEGCVTSTGLRITSESISKFQSKYVSLASIAKPVGTSSRALMRICDANRIKVLMVPRAGRAVRQPFIQLSDRSKLVKVRSISDKSS